MRRDLNTQTEMFFFQPLKLIKVNVSTYQMSSRTVPQQQHICLHSCCGSTWRHMSLSWQSAADDDLTVCSLAWLEPCRTVTGRPGCRPSWNPPAAEPEASAAPVAPASRGHSVERLTPNVRPHSEQTAAGSSDRRWCRRTVSCSSPGSIKWTSVLTASDDIDPTSGRSCCSW